MKEEKEAKKSKKQAYITETGKPFDYKVDPVVGDQVLKNLDLNKGVIRFLEVRDTLFDGDLAKGFNLRGGEMVVVLGFRGVIPSILAFILARYNNEREMNANSINL